MRAFINVALAFYYKEKTYKCCILDKTLNNLTEIS